MRKYKVGDKVKIKSAEWYRNNKKMAAYKGACFTEEMARLNCGKIFTIGKVSNTNNKEGNIYILNDSGHWSWESWMFENNGEQLEFDFGDKK